MRKARAVQFGCGPIGCSVVRYAARRPDIELVGAVDIDESLVGRDLGEVAGVERRLGATVFDNAEAVLSQAKPDVVFLTTSSAIRVVHPQVETCAAAGCNVVSTCEELAYPYDRSPQVAAEIDRVAKESGISVLGTGVNPGFVMDAWPLFMTGICQEVTRVRVARVQDASSRRGPFQKKIGAGCTVEEFNRLKAEGMIKHVGLPESIALIASGLRWKLDEITETIEPVVAQSQVTTDFVTVEPGQAAGVRQVGRGLRQGQEVITLEFVAFVGAPESYDSVSISGSPDLEVVVKGGVHGDVATAAVVVNSVHRVIGAPPGLLTVKDLPIVSTLGSRS